MMEVRGMLWVTKYPKARAIRTGVDAQRQPTVALWAVMAQRCNWPPYRRSLLRTMNTRVRARYICVLCLYSFLEIKRIFVFKV